MRLTRRFTKEEIELFNKHSDDRIFELGDYCNRNESTHTSEIYNKLGQLEDIEEELGVDLVNLFKALKEGFFDCLGEYHHFSNLYFSDEEIFDGYTRQSYNIEDYGKTWALTKEELE